MKNQIVHFSSYKVREGLLKCVSKINVIIYADRKTVSKRICQLRAKTKAKTKT